MGVVGESRPGGEPSDGGEPSRGGGAGPLAAGEPRVQRAEEQRLEPGARLERERARGGLLPTFADSSDLVAVAGEGEPAADAGAAGGERRRGGPFGEPEKPGGL